MVSRLTKRLLKLELIDGPGIIPKGREGEGRHRFCQSSGKETCKPVAVGKLCSVSRRSCLGGCTAGRGAS